ncbi:MAG: hypothetical protein WCO56_28795 [Verrucomicrobiota bacterium]
MPLTNTVILTNDQIRLISGPLSNLVVRVTAKDGSVSGTFLAPGAKIPTAYKATLLQTPMLTSGGGFFLGINHAGYLKLLPIKQQPGRLTARESQAVVRWNQDREANDATMSRNGPVQAHSESKKNTFDRGRILLVDNEPLTNNLFSA